MKQLLFSILFGSLLAVSCTPKEVAIEKRIIGSFEVVRATCGVDTSEFLYQGYEGIIFNEDNTGLDVTSSSDKSFEWYIINERLEICFTTSSNPIYLPFELRGDTLEIGRSNNLCPHLNIFYVRL